LRDRRDHGGADARAIPFNVANVTADQRQRHEGERRRPARPSVRPKNARRGKRHEAKGNEDDHVADKKRRSNQRAGREQQQRPRRRAPQRQLRKHASRNGERGRAQAVRRDRLVDHELQRGGISRRHAETQP